jgi:hypothetical protein
MPAKRPPPPPPPPAAETRSNCSRDRGPRALLEAVGAVAVLFWLSWRLAPAISMVIVATAVTAAVYRKYTKAVEQQQSKALQQMSSVATQVGRPLAAAWRAPHQDPLQRGARLQPSTPCPGGCGGPARGRGGALGRPTPPALARRPLLPGLWLPPRLLPLPLGSQAR